MQLGLFITSFNCLSAGFNAAYLRFACLNNYAYLCNRCIIYYLPGRHKFYNVEALTVPQIIYRLA